MTNAPMRSFAVVPAAGRGVRMGQPKLLLPWKHSTILGHVLAAWRLGGISEVVLVAHRDDHELARLARAARVHVVIPETPPPQMKDSVLAALQYIESTFQPAQSDVWLLAPADMPSLSPAVIAQLLKNHDADRPAILVPCHGSHRGHPVLIPWPFAARVATLAPDQGINALIDAGPTQRIELGPAATPPDIDTPADFLMGSDG